MGFETKFEAGTIEIAELREKYGLDPLCSQEDIEPVAIQLFGQSDVESSENAASLVMNRAIRVTDEDFGFIHPLVSRLSPKDKHGLVLLALGIEEATDI